MKITSFNSANLSTLRADIQAALNEVAAKHGLEKLQMGNISYESNRFSAKLTAETERQVADNGVVQLTPREKMILEMNRLPVDLLSRTVTIQGASFRITGLQPNKPKNLIALERVSDGRTFQCSAEQMRRTLVIQ